MSEPEPEIEAPEIAVVEETLRQRLDRARGGSRLVQYEETLARRRRERDRDQQLATDDEYRSKQRVSAQKVFNQYFGNYLTPPLLTGELHNNPTVEARSGEFGGTFRGALYAATRPMARDEDGIFQIVDTKKEILKSTLE